MTKDEAKELLRQVTKDDKRSVIRRLQKQLEDEGYEIKVEIDPSVYDQ